MEEHEEFVRIIEDLLGLFEDLEKSFFIIFEKNNNKKGHLLISIDLLSQHSENIRSLGGSFL